MDKRNAYDDRRAKRDAERDAQEAAQVRACTWRLHCECPHGACTISYAGRCIEAVTQVVAACAISGGAWVPYIVKNHVAGGPP